MKIDTQTNTHRVEDRQTLTHKGRQTDTDRHTDTQIEI